MTTFFISLLVISLFMLALGLGVVFGRAPIRGSCGGVNGAGGCELCSGTCPRRKNGARQTAPNREREN